MMEYSSNWRIVVVLNYKIDLTGSEHATWWKRNISLGPCRLYVINGPTSLECGFGSNNKKPKQPITLWEGLVQHVSTLYNNHFLIGAHLFNYISFAYLVLFYHQKIRQITEKRSQLFSPNKNIYVRFKKKKPINSYRHKWTRFNRGGQLCLCK